MGTVQSSSEQFSRMNRSKRIWMYECMLFFMPSDMSLSSMKSVSMKYTASEIGKLSLRRIVIMNSAAGMQLTLCCLT